MTVLMECGHAAQAVDKDGKPVCAICIGRKPEARQPAKDEPDLTGRVARCHYASTANRSTSMARRKCRGEVPSGTGLAFFQHLPDQEKDSFYCGCHGWD